MKVTYKDTLLDTAEGEPPMKPYEYNEKGDKVTSPKGLLFIKAGTTVDLSLPAPVEAWKHSDTDDAEGLIKKDVWQKKKVSCLWCTCDAPVFTLPHPATCIAAWQTRILMDAQVMSDILNHRMVDFSAVQQDQWRALNEFHEFYRTSDAVPDLPIHIRAGELAHSTASHKLLHK